MGAGKAKQRKVMFASSFGYRNLLKQKFSTYGLALPDDKVQDLLFIFSFDVDVDFLVG